MTGSQVTKRQKVALLYQVRSFILRLTGIISAKSITHLEQCFISQSPTQPFLVASRNAPPTNGC